MVDLAQHVLFVGIDGVRWDVLQTMPTPNLDRVSRAGFCSALQIHPSGPSISGPCWTTMLTGTLPPTHGVSDNDFSSYRRSDHPDVITAATRHRNQLQSWAGADWLPLVTENSGGPLLAGGGYPADRRRAPDDTAADWYDGDQQVVDRAVAALRGFASEPGSISYVYLHAVDVAGHRLGVGDGYREAIVESDRRLGSVLDAVESRATRDQEEWLIIVATDHGHRDEGGHGEDSVEERTAWIAACGPAVPTRSSVVLEQADIAAHIHHVLGIPLPGEGFVGQPFGTRD